MRFVTPQSRRAVKATRLRYSLDTRLRNGCSSSKTCSKYSNSCSCTSCSEWGPQVKYQTIQSHHNCRHSSSFHPRFCRDLLAELRAPLTIKTSRSRWGTWFWGRYLLKFWQSPGIMLVSLRIWTLRQCFPTMNATISLLLVAKSARVRRKTKLTWFIDTLAKTTSKLSMWARVKSSLLSSSKSKTVVSWETLRRTTSWRTC